MKNQTDPEIETFSIPRLAALTQRDRRWIERQLERVQCTVAGKSRSYALADALPALLAEDPAQRATEKRTAEHREREARAKADLRELERAQQMGTLGSLADLRAIMADYWTRSRVAITSAEFLNDKQRRQTLAMLNSITLGESGA